ncbi:MAG: hypothetical protein ACJAYR_000305 [Sneathiella sp.]|jgi:hypothetical protein
MTQKRSRIALLFLKSFYLFLSKVLALTHYFTEARSQGSFSSIHFLSEQAENIRYLISQFSFYSIVIFTSMGYSDITPVSRIAKSWISIEALFGQFYFAIVIARPISMNKNAGKV